MAASTAAAAEFVPIRLGAGLGPHDHRARRPVQPAQEQLGSEGHAQQTSWEVQKLHQLLSISRAHVAALEDAALKDAPAKDELSMHLQAVQKQVQEQIAEADALKVAKEQAKIALQNVQQQMHREKFRLMR